MNEQKDNTHTQAVSEKKAKKCQVKNASNISTKEASTEVLSVSSKPGNIIKDICDRMDREEDNDYTTLPVSANDFRVGTEFDNMDDFVRLWRAYCTQTYCNWVIGWIRLRPSPGECTSVSLFDLADLCRN